jgi:hypothetical protein
LRLYKEKEMADLIEKFFRKDLTEAEEEALEKELSSSDEAVQKLALKAEETYRSFGLPEPHWTGSEELKRTPKLDYGPWVLLALFLSLLVGLAVWGLLRNSSPQAGLTPVKTPVPTQVVKQVQKTTLPIQNHNLKMATTHTIPTQSELGHDTPVPSLPSLAPMTTPVNMDQNPDQTFSGHFIQLHLSSPQSVVVSVLDGQGNELLPLFNGTLPTGTWAFEWNGLLKDGHLAPPGKYKIEVRAGSWSQTKDLLIPK